MPLPDSESPEHSLRNCAICMDAIILDTPTRRRSKSTDEWKELGAGGGGGGLLNAMQMGVVGARAAKKNYSLAPCHHLFVSLIFGGCVLFFTYYLYISIRSALNGYVLDRFLFVFTELIICCPTNSGSLSKFVPLFLFPCPYRSHY
jgi:hypothetical protein